MKVTIDEEFNLNEPIDKVWNYLQDVKKVVICVPGATITEIIDDKNFTGKISVKIGPITSNYDGKGEITESNYETKEMKISGKGVDAKGQGNAEMEMTAKLIVIEDTITQMTATMNVIISGKVAQLGSRMIKAVNKQMFKKFVKNLTENLANEENIDYDKQNKPVGAISIGLIVFFLAITSPFRKLFNWIFRRNKK